MPSPWRKFAAEAPYWYIWTDFDGDLDAFWASGARQAEEILSCVGGRLDGDERVVEIGCGVGRVLLPMAARFRHCTGVDLAPEMIALLRKHAGERGLADRVEGRLPEEGWDEERADLVYSIITLQHIGSLDVIERYIERSARALAAGGLGYFHFDTRPATVAYRLKNALPDALLRKNWRRGVRRIRRGPATIRALLGRHGFRIEKELEPGTERHAFVATR